MSNSLETKLRFLLQTSASKRIETLKPDQIKILDDLNSTPKTPNLSTTIDKIISDLGLNTATPIPGTVLATINQYSNPQQLQIDPQCTLQNPSQCDRYVIWFQCADRKVDPVVMSAPTTKEGREEAYVYIDTHTFSGFGPASLAYLKNLGIQRICVFSFDGDQYTSPTNGFVRLADRQAFTNTTIDPQLDTTYRNIFLAASAFLVTVAISHKIIR